MSGDEWIEEAVRAGLERFNATYADAVEKLELRPLLRKCNPWRLRALGLKDCTEVVRRLVDDHMSSSAESKFGNTFIESLVGQTPGVEPSGVEDIDFARGKTLVSVKSGFNWGNNSQWKNLEATTTAALKRYRQHPGKKNADCVLGVAIGRGARTPRSGIFPFKELRGQAFWKWISDDPELYEKVMIQIDKQAGEYEERRDSALRRLRGDMQRNFSLNGGMLVDWIKLNRYVSAECPPPP